MKTKRVNKVITSLLLVVSMLALVAVAVVATQATRTDAQSVTPSPTQTASTSVQPADGIEIQQPGQTEVVVYWDISDAQAVAWVAYVNLTQWLNTATGDSQWGNAIQWTQGQWVKTERRSCSHSLCLKDGILVSGLTASDTYIFTVVKSADGYGGYVWPEPVWHSLGSTVAALTPVPTAVPAPVTDVCDTPFAAVLPECGGTFPTLTPTRTPTPTPTAVPAPVTDVCDTPFASLLPKCG